MRWLQNRQKAIENWLGSFLWGLMEGIAYPAVVTLVLWGLVMWADFADPSSTLLYALAQIGAALFIAYAIATAGAAAYTGKNLRRHLSWLGFTCGGGITGVLGIAFSLGLAASRDAGHAGWLDLLGLSWIITSFSLLGLLVAMLPWLTYHWSRQEGSET
jgi:hypothetical protein